MLGKITCRHKFHGFRSLKAAILGYGATGKGALRALFNFGVKKNTVFMAHPRKLRNDQSGMARVESIKINDEVYLSEGDKYVLSADALSEYQIIVNCVKQDPCHPINFIKASDVLKLSSARLIVDVSCDTGMGFSFSKATSFSDPLVNIPSVNALLYSVDHSPNVYFETATRSISKRCLEFLEFFVSGNWTDSFALKNAVDIDKGVVKNNEIIKFQSQAY